MAKVKVEGSQGKPVFKKHKNRGAVDKVISNNKIKRKGKRMSTIKKEKDPRGVVYLSHIPHGFYDEQIKGYFSQFGKVTAVSVPRSKRGRVRGYAFIEYKHPEIAKIAAETMDNYLMFNRLLKAKYIPPEQQKPHLFTMAKEAREKHKTAADQAALAVKHNRKVKNRHRTINLEAKSAKKLLKKKCELLRRGEQFGLGNNVAIGEVNLESIIEKRKEVLANKKIVSDGENIKSDEGKCYSSNGTIKIEKRKEVLANKKIVSDGENIKLNEGKCYSSNCTIKMIKSEPAENKKTEPAENKKTKKGQADLFKSFMQDWGIVPQKKKKQGKPRVKVSAQ